jgi:hypothetical protein
MSQHGSWSQIHFTLLQSSRFTHAWLRPCTSGIPSRVNAFVMDSAHSFDAFIDPSRFGALVRTRSWEWLDALSRRLHLEVQIVDALGHSRLPSNAPAQTSLAQLVASGASDLRTLVSAAVTLRTRQTATIEGLRISAYPLSDRGEIVGIVLIAYAMVARRSLALDEQIDPEVAAQSILHGIHAHLQSTPAAARAYVDDVASLGHVLDATAAHGTDRELVGAFAAAIAFWKRIDVYGYVMAADGIFAAEVAPPVPMQPQMPGTIPASSLPSASALTALSAAQIQALGLTHCPDVLVARIPDGDFPWLIVFCGSIPRADAARLALYVRLLDQLVRTVIAETSNKLLTAVSAHLLEHGDATNDATAATLDALNASTGMSASALKVTTGYGAPLIEIGQTEARPGEVSAGSRLVIVRRVPNRYTLSLVLSPGDSRRMSRQQRDLAEVTANLLDAWIRSLLGRLQQQDRRTSSRTFDEVLDRFAAQALERGSTVSVVVLLMADAACFPGLTQQWIARIRGTMRASDIVGMLGEGEIGLLLHDTGHDRAEAVAHRILKMLDTSEDRSSSPIVATGVATRSPGATGGAGIAADARSDAMSRATASLIHQEPRSQSHEDPR